MSAQELVEAAMRLSEKERLDLARRIVESVGVEQVISERIADAVQGIEDVVTGKIVGLSETEFRRAFSQYGIAGRKGDS